MIIHSQTFMDADRVEVESYERGIVIRIRRHGEGGPPEGAHQSILIHPPVGMRFDVCTQQIDATPIPEEEPNE